MMDPIERASALTVELCRYTLRQIMECGRAYPPGMERTVGAGDDWTTLMLEVNADMARTYLPTGRAYQEAIVQWLDSVPHEDGQKLVLPNGTAGTDVYQLTVTEDFPQYGHAAEEQR